MAQRVFYCDDLRKHIFSFVGAPLPPDEPYHSSFDCLTYKCYFRRKNGKIGYRVERKNIKCKSCKVWFLSTGYPCCSSCYRKFDKERREFGRTECPQYNKNNKCSGIFTNKNGYKYCYSCSQLRKEDFHSSGLPKNAGCLILDSDSD